METLQKLYPPVGAYQLFFSSAVDQIRRDGKSPVNKAALYAGTPI
jgi:hypothetical protein